MLFQYIRHEHKNPASLECEVTSAGRLALCLWANATPKRLKLSGRWTVSGTMGESTGTDTWTIYETQAERGQKIALPAPDRWGAVVLAKSIQIREAPVTGEFDAAHPEIEF